MRADEPILVVPDASVLAQRFLPDGGICSSSERLMADVGSRQVALVALAESHRCMHYTADRRLVAALRGHTDRVNLISEYPAGWLCERPHLSSRPKRPSACPFSSVLL